jgi:hypothetical protein
MAALIAFCDLLAAQGVTLQAALELLERKGLLSESEITQAIGSRPPGSTAAEISVTLQKALMQRIEATYQAILLHSEPKGPTQ